MWPPSRHGAYQNVSSTEELALRDSPNLSTPGTGMSIAYKSLLTPKISPSPYNTPGLDSTQTTPNLGGSPGDLKYESEQLRRSWFGYGWRGGARIAFIGTSLVLVTNITLMLYMTLAYEKMDGFPVIYRGSCENAEQQNSLWHFFLNVLSTGLLSASNYCMQLLSAPTRANINRAHSTGHWLDIGIPSIRNLRFSDWKRRSLWLLLCVSSIPLHLVYNSTFYAAIATNDYNILYATEDFVNGGGYDTSKFPTTSAQNITFFHNDAKNWTYLNNQDCIQNYAHDFITKYRNVIAVVANETTAADDTLLALAVNELPKSGYLDATFDPFAWICNDTQTTNKTGVHDRNSVGFVPCASQARELEDMADTWWKSGGYHISHCLAEAIHPDCHLHFSPHLMGPVILMNIIKCLVAFYVAFRMVDTPLVTLGDAIQSFVKQPDPTTTGLCLTTAHEAERTFGRTAAHMAPRPPQTFQAQRHRWAKVITKRQWLLLLSMLSIMVLGLLGGIIVGTKSLAPPTIANAWSISLGTVETQNLVLGANLPQLGASAVLITALVANAPQALLSFLYMVYNTIFTLLYLGDDWDMFGAYTGTTKSRFRFTSKKQTHRYLRVSNPKGNQKSTHFLNLPYRYAIPLICVSGFLHWLMSQSLYLANISVIPRDGTLPRHDEITTVAFAPQGMIWLTALALVMAAVVLGSGLRKFGGQMSIVGSNSAAISAACHLEMMPERRRREMVLRKVAWGEIPSSGTEETQRPRHVDSFMGGLGIDTSSRGGAKTGTVYTADDFSEVMDRNSDDLEGGGYEAVRGDVELIDSRGVGKSSAVAHCSFSDGFVFKPEVGKVYA